MKTKWVFIVVFFVLTANTVFAKIQKKTPKKDSIAVSKWSHINRAKLTLTQNSFLNWSAGGNNSVSGIFELLFVKKYKQDFLFWNNQVKAVYGLNKEESRMLRKTQDMFEVNSTFGYREDKSSEWYYSAKLNFKTQFANGYKYPNTQKAISKFFSPAYLFLGVGAEYYSAPKKFKVYLSPITNKSTFVYSKRLADEGAFGVQKAIYNADGELIRKGKNTKIEFGTLISGEWHTKIMENIKMEQKLALYSDYLNNFGNIDVNWEVNFDMTINKYIQASLGANLLYDDDVKHKEDINNDGKLEILGPRVQLKQLLGIGLSYNF